MTLIRTAVGLCATLLVAACSGSAPPPGKTGGGPATGAAAPTGDAGAPPPADPGGDPSEGGGSDKPSKFAEHIPNQDAILAAVGGPANGKLLRIFDASPKTYKSLVKNYLWRPITDCPSTDLVEVAATTGVVVPADRKVKVKQDVLKRIEQAGALAMQRGMVIDVVAGQRTIKEAVREWNEAIIDAAFELVKLNKADAKQKSFAGEAKKAMARGDGPRSWVDVNPCETGELGGFAVEVQLVTLDPLGKPANVLVKAGSEGAAFTKDNLLTTYWDKKIGKPFRTLTEIMSAGGFTRVCSRASRFVLHKVFEGSWRCREGDEGWDPENRPLPAWQ